jgi:hypothetical protein
MEREGLAVMRSPMKQNSESGTVRLCSCVLGMNCAIWNQNN